MTLNWKRPIGVEKAVFSRSGSVTSTCHYPEAGSTHPTCRQCAGVVEHRHGLRHSACGNQRGTEVTRPSFAPVQQVNSKARMRARSRRIPTSVPLGGGAAVALWAEPHPFRCGV
ncbi:tRNA- methyltransferase [Trichinella spiralis]|uniref:tRNA- methyltransferase n=1 Tax=Trichinella spiralis TaxID=6334 RepID=UPI0001EFC325|nr:tRNA- methyltransferase [Trichinella spiralis]